MRYHDTEVYGFPRSAFPKEWRGHQIQLLHNDIQPTVDDRLDYHVTLHCPKCEEEKTVRGRLPPEASDEWRAAVIKLIAFGWFNSECQGSNHKTYYPSSQT